MFRFSGLEHEKKMKIHIIKSNRKVPIPFLINNIE